MNDAQVFSATIELFGDFAYEFRDWETNSFYTYPLGDVARHKAAWIDRTLNGLSQTLRPLLSTGWACHWSGLDFDLECHRSSDSAKRELREAAGTIAECFDISDDTQEFRYVPPGYMWGPRWPLDAADPHQPTRLRYEPQTLVEVQVLHTFDIEMELSGVMLNERHYCGPMPPLVRWPAVDFDLPDWIANLGHSIHQRLNDLADLFDRIESESDSWIWHPTASSVVYESPLLREESAALFRDWTTRMDRVSIQPAP